MCQHKRVCWRNCNLLSPSCNKSSSRALWKFVHNKPIRFERQPRVQILLFLFAFVSLDLGLGLWTGTWNRACSIISWRYYKNISSEHLLVYQLFVLPSNITESEAENIKTTWHGFHLTVNAREFVERKCNAIGLHLVNFELIEVRRCFVIVSLFRSN